MLKCLCVDWNRTFWIWMRRLPEMFAIFKSFMSIKTQMLPKRIQKITPSMLKDVLSKIKRTHLLHGRMLSKWLTDPKESYCEGWARATSEWPWYYQITKHLPLHSSEALERSRLQKMLDVLLSNEPACISTCEALQMYNEIYKYTTNHLLNSWSWVIKSGSEIRKKETALHRLLQRPDCRQRRWCYLYVWWNCILWIAITKTKSSLSSYGFKFSAVLLVVLYYIVVLNSISKLGHTFKILLRSFSHQALNLLWVAAATDQLLVGLTKLFFCWLDQARTS